MHAFKALVRNGRLIVDEPTDLPDGTLLELVVGVYCLLWIATPIV